MNTHGKRVLITGAAGGLGTATMAALVEKGCKVVGIDKVASARFEAETIVADLTDEAQTKDAVAAAIERLGGLDVLINNAGVFIPKRFTEYTTEDFATLVSTTLAGFLYVSQLAVKQMLRQKSGSIINVSTTLVDQPIAGVGAAVQIMLKGALNAVTRALAIEYAKDGIRVNTIAPGVINTPMHKPETHDFLKGLHPVGRIGEVKEVVDAALFLTEATFTSGEILHVDGGAHAGKW